MQIVRCPFRISFFGGSTDYKDFYENHGSFIIGTTIDKYVYCFIRKRPEIGPRQSVISYSKLETVDDINDIQNNLIRETLKYHNLDRPVELHFFSDIPSRTGLGGSSSFCVGLSHLLRNFLNKSTSKRDVALDAIEIERHILSESGGIQDQIHASYGGFNSIEINTDGRFSVKPMPLSSEFLEYFEDSLLLIYTGKQRNTDVIAQSHSGKDKTHILDIAKEAYGYFLKEDIQNIGKLLYSSWEEKRSISEHISNSHINNMIETIMSKGAYGVKLLGSGGSGFILCLCNPIAKKLIQDVFGENILEFKFEKEGVKEIYKI